jgi:hypothetical protein
MTRKVLGLILLLAGSEAIGFLAASRYFHLFRATVPPALMTNFNLTSAHAAFLLYGAALGVGIFVWAVLAVVLSRFFRPA